MKYLIVGLGVFGRNLTQNLAQLGAEVIAIDRRDDNVSAVKDLASTAVCAPFDDPTVLERFPVDDFDAVILAIGDDFEASLAFTMKAQELGAKRLVCRVLSPMHERLLRLLKVERLVIPEEFTARGLAHSMLLQGVVNGIDLGSGYALVEVEIPPPFVGPDSEWKRKLFSRFAIRLVTVKRPEKGLVAGLLGRNAAPEAPLRTLGPVSLAEPFEAGDLLVIFGQDKDLRRFLEEANAG